MNVHLILIIIISFVLYLIFKGRHKIYYSEINVNDVEEINFMEETTYDNINDSPSIDFLYKIVERCPDLTMVARNNKGEILGVIYSGLINGTKVTENKINRGHVDDGDTLFVYSLCVKNELRGKGIGRRIADHYYNEWIPKHSKREIKCISVSVRDKHVQWMKELGFNMVGPSEIKYGNEPWIDLVKCVDKANF
jgi:predicted N-acetyltransferase YhbS